jgi:hypothetical protein
LEKEKNNIVISEQLFALLNNAAGIRIYSQHSPFLLGKFAWAPFVAAQTNRRISISVYVTRNRIRIYFILGQ